MKIIKHNNWVEGQSYKKRILFEELQGKINLIEDVIVEAKGKIPSHAHEYTDELFYITENSVIMIVDGESFEIGPGDMIYVLKGEEHGFENNSEYEFKMLVCKINYQKGDSYLH